MVLAALPFAVYATGGSDAEFTIALAVQALTMALMFLPAGVIGDRFNRRRVVVASDLLRFAGRGTFAVLLVLGDASFWHLILAQVAQGTGTALFQSTMDGFVPEVIWGGERRLRKTNALRSGALALGLAIGPAIGGIIFATLGAGWAFGVDALTFLGSAALFWGLSTPPTPKAEPASVSAVLREAREGLRAFRQIPWFWRVALQAAVVNTLVFAPFLILGPAATGGIGGWSAVLLALGCGELVGTVGVMEWEPRRPLFAATALIALWAPLLLLLAFAPLAFIVAGAVAAGVSNSIFDALWETTKQSHTPERLRARLGSLDLLGSLGLLPIGYLIGGAALAAIGSGPSLAIGAAILLAATVCVASSPSVQAVTPLADEDVDLGDDAPASPTPRLALAPGSE